MPGTDKLVSIALERAAEVQAHVCNSAGSAIDLVDQHRASQEINGFRPFVRNFTYRTQWNFHIGIAFLHWHLAALGIVAYATIIMVPYCSCIVNGCNSNYFILYSWHGYRA